MADVELSLIVLHSTDIERAAGFYSTLGIKFQRERHNTGPEHLAALVGSVVLEIYPQVDAAISVGVRVGFRVSSVDKVIEAVRQAGGTVTTLPRRGPWGYRAVLTDPDGRRVEIIEEERADRMSD